MNLFRTMGLRRDPTWTGDVDEATYKSGWNDCLIAISNMRMRVVPIDPEEGQWGGLARDMMMWLEMERPTPGKLFLHLERLGRPAPPWLLEETEMRNLDHVPSKGTRAVLVYKAMVLASPVDVHEHPTRPVVNQKTADLTNNPCPGCFSTECNGECSGDGLMGG